jgi:hypothetical protein
MYLHATAQHNTTHASSGIQTHYPSLHMAQAHMTTGATSLLKQKPTWRRNCIVTVLSCSTEAFAKSTLHPSSRGTCHGQHLDPGSIPLEWHVGVIWCFHQHSVTNNWVWPFHTAAVMQNEICKIKVKLSLCFNWVPHHNGTWEDGDTAPCILELITRWRWVVSFMSQLLYPQGKSPWNPLDRRLGGPQSQSGHSSEEKNSQTLQKLEPPII